MGPLDHSLLKSYFEDFVNAEAARERAEGTRHHARETRHKSQMLREETRHLLGKCRQARQAASCKMGTLTNSETVYERED